MAKRGFFAEMNYQAQQAEKRRRQQEAQAARAYSAAVREQERAHKASERARAAAARASEAERKAADKEAARLHVEARTAEVDALNKNLATSYEDLDSLLAWTLTFDDFVDLEALKVTAEHPPFVPGDLATPISPVPELVYPPQPTYVEPAAPKGLSGAFGGKKRHAEAIEAAKAAHNKALQDWHEAATRQHAAHVQKLEDHKKAEADRVVKLAEAEKAYQNDCAQREEDAAQKNAELARFINDLAFDLEYAIRDYVGIVLSNSVYPDTLPVEHEYSFDLATRELTLQLNVPEPSALPSVKEYRYIKAKDEIAESQLPVKAQKDRYASVVHQIALRSLHEVFEADRAGKIHSIALTVGVKRVAPATGQPEFVPLVMVAADRDTFNSFDLSNVVPAATLEHLGAAISKSPFDVTPADTSRGVRQRSK
jgi:restriction system protein